MGGDSPGPEWWSKFGAAYDEALEDEAAGSAAPLTTSADRAPRTEEVLQDQMALNARTLAQVRAKSQLLDVSESTTSRLKLELAETRATSEARERALQAALDDARATNDALQASLKDASAEAARCRARDADSRVRLETLTSEHEFETAAMRRSLIEASEARDAAERGLHNLQDHAAEAEAERQALKLCLEEERGGGALERLARLLLKVQPTPPSGQGGGEGGSEGGGGESSTTGGLQAASVASRIERLTEWAQEKVEAAEAAAEAARAQAAKAIMDLEAAPRAEALRAQAEQAAEARAANRTIAAQLRELQREMAAMRIKLAAASERAEAAEDVLSKYAAARLAGASAGGEGAHEEEGLEAAADAGGIGGGGGDGGGGGGGGGAGAGGRTARGGGWARPTNSSTMRRVEAPSKGVAAAAKKGEAAKGRAAARRVVRPALSGSSSSAAPGARTPQEVLMWQLAAGSRTPVDGVFTEDVSPSSGELDEVLRILCARRGLDDPSPPLATPRHPSPPLATPRPLSSCGWCESDRAFARRPCRRPLTERCAPPGRLAPAPPLLCPPPQVGVPRRRLRPGGRPAADGHARCRRRCGG